MERQAALERAGSTFWRVFGSQWASDRERWMADLVGTLDSMGIAPIGGAGVSDDFVELRLVDARTPTGKLDEALPDLPPDTQSEIAVAAAPLPEENTDNQRPVSWGAATETGDLFERPVRGDEEIVVGSRVRVRYPDGHEADLVIVAGKADTSKSELSADSPLGAELIGACAGDMAEYGDGKFARTALILSVETSRSAA